MTLLPLVNRFASQNREQNYVLGRTSRLHAENCAGEAVLLAGHL